MVMRWTPDICGCVFEYDADPSAVDADPPGLRLVRYDASGCRSTHAGLTLDGAHTRVKEETRRKNTAKEIVRSYAAQHAPDLLAGVGEIEGVLFDYSFDALDVLVVELPGFSQPQKMAIGVLFGQSMGAGKAKLK